MIIYPKNKNSYFYNGETIIAPPLYLGKYDSEDNWEEITEEEKETIEKDWEVEQNADNN